MTVKEWSARLVRPEYISGLVIATRYGIHVGEAIFTLDHNIHGDIIMWSVPPSTWPRGLVTITILPPEVLYDAEVLRHVGQDWAIYDGDIVRLREWGVTQAYGLPPEVWVFATRNSESGVFTGAFMNGDQKTDRIVSFLPSDVRAIKRLETP